MKKIPEIELLKLTMIISDAVTEYEDWKRKCGSSGWYDMPKQHYRDFIKKHLVMAYKVGRDNENQESTSNETALALEFGYKECEKGNNIQMAFANYNKITNHP